jgi:hypothetical protein
MRSLIVAAAVLLPTAVFAVEVVEVNARDHSCRELAQIIQQKKAVFIRMGIGGRSFRYPPVQCRLGDKYSVARLRAANGQMCVLDYECVYDPQSFYNRFPK